MPTWRIDLQIIPQVIIRFRFASKGPPIDYVTRLVRAQLPSAVLVSGARGFDSAAWKGLSTDICSQEGWRVDDSVRTARSSLLLLQQTQSLMDLRVGGRSSARHHSTP